MTASRKTRAVNRSALDHSKKPGKSRTAGSVGPTTGARKITRPSKSGPSKTAASGRRWSKRVMEQSDAMDLQAGVFTLKSPAAIARSLKKSAESSARRKSSPFRSAMSMLNFEINRAGTNLTRERLTALNKAKLELRKAFNRAT